MHTELGAMISRRMDYQRKAGLQDEAGTILCHHLQTGSGSTQHTILSSEHIIEVYALSDHAAGTLME